MNPTVLIVVSICQVPVLAFHTGLGVVGLTSAVWTGIRHVEHRRSLSATVGTATLAKYTDVCDATVSVPNVQELLFRLTKCVEKTTIKNTLSCQRIKVSARIKLHSTTPQWDTLMETMLEGTS